MLACSHHWFAFSRRKRTSTIVTDRVMPACPTVSLNTSRTDPRPLSRPPTGIFDFTHPSGTAFVLLLLALQKTSVSMNQRRPPTHGLVQHACLRELAQWANCVELPCLPSSNHATRSALGRKIQGRLFFFFSFALVRMETPQYPTRCFVFSPLSLVL